VAETIQDFLGSLGFNIDESQQNRFTDALTKSRQVIEQLGKGITGAMQQLANMATVAMGTAIGIGAALTKSGEDFASLGNAAARIGTAPQHIRAFEYAVQQLGGTAAEARRHLKASPNFNARTQAFYRTTEPSRGNDPLDCLAFARRTEAGSATVGPRECFNFSLALRL
jgi:hypothetical protein